MPSNSLYRNLVLALALLGTVPAVRAAQDDLRLEVARQWAEKGEYEKAVQELRLFLTEHPDAAEVYARIGTLRLRQGKLHLAGENFKVALAKDPNLVEAKQGIAKVKEQEAKAGAPGSASGRKIPVEPAKDGKSAHSPQPKAAPHAAHKVEPAPGVAYSPALDSSSQAASTGIYAQKEFQDALRLYKEKKPEEALAALKKSLAKAPGHPGAYYLGGVIRYEKGDLAKAAYNFKRSLDYPDRGYNANFYLGRIHQKQDRDREAIDFYEKYLKETKSEAGRKQAQAFLVQLRGGKLPEPAPKEPDAHKPEAKTPADTGHGHGHGHEHGNEGHAVGDSASNGHGAGGHEEAGGHGDHGKVPPVDEPAVDKPLTPLVLSEDGYLPFVVADTAGASGRKLAEAYAAFKREKFEKSADLLKEIIKLYGGSPNAEAAELDLAAVYVRLGLWDNARDRILDYLGKSKDPSRYRDLAFYLEALMHLGKKDGEKAERTLLKVKAGGYGGPSQEEIDYRLAQAGELMKDMKKWAAYLEKAQASARDPLRKAQLWQQLGALHGKHGRPDRALEFYRKSMEKCGKGEGASGEVEGMPELCGESQLRVADLEFRRKNWKSAMAEYRKFAAQYPDHKESAWVHYQIGNVYQASRNLESALNEYKKVIDNYPDSYWAGQAQWKREDAIWRKEYEEVLD